MKLIVAFIRPELLSCVQLALKRFEIDSISVTETQDYGPQEGTTLIYRSAEIRVRSSVKLRLEMIVNDHEAEDIVDAIVDSGVPVRRGLRSDCKVLVVSLEQYIRLSESDYGSMRAKPR